MQNTVISFSLAELRHEKINNFFFVCVTHTCELMGTMSSNLFKYSDSGPNVNRNDVK